MVRLFATLCVKGYEVELRILLIVLLVMACNSQVYANGHRPNGENCNIDIPPENSGEDSHMYGGIFKVFPRAKDIGKTYTGCQTIWHNPATGSDPLANLKLLTVIKLKNGNIAHSWSPDGAAFNINECKYENGKELKTNGKACYRAEHLPIKSMRPGCLKELLAATYDRTLPLPKDCLNYE